MIKKVFIILNVFFLFTGCQKFVENTSPSISAVSDDEINNVNNIQFFINGAKNAYADAHDYMSLYADGLSDQLVHDRNVEGSTGPGDEAIDKGNWDYTDGSKETIYNNISEAWRTANILKEKLDIIDGEEEVENEGYHIAYLYQGLACYLLGTYYGRGPNYPDDGGATLDTSSFIPSSDLYEMALAYFDSSSVYANAYQNKVLHSVIARLHLYDGNYPDAADNASQGLGVGDPPFEALYTDEFSNIYYSNAGLGRARWTLNSRFRLLLGENFEDENGDGEWDNGEAWEDCALPNDGGSNSTNGDGVYNPPSEPDERFRIPLMTAPMKDDIGYYRYYQTKYLGDTPLPIITWQEVYLIMAELDLRDGSEENARMLMNQVRISHNISEIDPGVRTTFKVLLEERDKELLCQGQRLIDQRRFENNEFILENGIWDSWESYSDCGSDGFCDADEDGYDPGTCSDTTFTDRTLCISSGTCSDDIYTSQEECENTGETWTSTDNVWMENLDPFGDDWDGTVGTEGNNQYDFGEDFNDEAYKLHWHTGPQHYILIPHEEELTNPNYP